MAVLIIVTVKDKSEMEEQNEVLFCFSSVYVKSCSSFKELRDHRWRNVIGNVKHFCFYNTRPNTIATVSCEKWEK